MIRFLSDENFNGPVIDGLFLRQPDLDLVRAIDVGLAEAEDAVLLEWAAAENRVVLTHDIETMPIVAYERLDAGLPMPGVLLVHKMTIASAIEEILFIALCGDESDVKDLVTYLPL
jgi:hypothetical protein